MGGMDEVVMVAYSTPARRDVDWISIAPDLTKVVCANDKV